MVVVERGIIIKIININSRSTLLLIVRAINSTSVQRRQLAKAARRRSRGTGAYSSNEAISLSMH